MTVTDSAANPIRFAAGGTNGMGYSTVAPDPLPHPMDDYDVDSTNLQDGDDDGKLWVGTVSRAAEGHTSALDK